MLGEEGIKPKARLLANEKTVAAANFRVGPPSWGRPLAGIGDRNRPANSAVAAGDDGFEAFSLPDPL